MAVESAASVPFVTPGGTGLAMRKAGNVSARRSRNQEAGFPSSGMGPVCPRGQRSGAGPASSPAPAASLAGR
jgi:hypothetical protein